MSSYDDYCSGCSHFVPEEGCELFPRPCADLYEDFLDSFDVQPHGSHTSGEGECSAPSNSRAFPEP